MSESFDPYRKWLGIPRDEQPPHHYRLLGIPLFEADPDVIENAAHRQMVYVRTFQTGKHAELSQKLLNELATAKVCLLTLERKAAYDQSLHQQLTETIATKGLNTQKDPASNADTLAGAPGAGQANSGLSAHCADDLPVAVPLNVGFAMTAPSTTSGTPRATRPWKRDRSRRLLIASIVFGSLGVVAVVAIVVSLALYQRGIRPPPTPDSDSPPGLTQAPTPPSLNRDSPLPATEAASDPTLVAREERLRKQFERIRQHLASRELSQANMLLQSMGALPRDAQSREEKERLEVVHRFLAEFWLAVDRGGERLRQRLEKLEEEGQDRVARFEFLGEEIAVQVAAEGDRVSLTMNGQESPGGFRALPAKAAAALAMIGLDDSDGFSRFYVAAHFLTDGQGNRQENRRLGEAFYRLAVKSVGQPNDFLAREFSLPESAATETELPISSDSLRIRPRLKRIPEL